jgi:hypothetical protein
VAPATADHDTVTFALPGWAVTLSGADDGGGSGGTRVRVVAATGAEIVIAQSIANVTSR